jgi:IS5 family transposase
MLKILLLQQWYHWSDPEAEFHVADSLTSRKFCGLLASEPVPDETTICRFRKRMGEAGMMDVLLEEVNRQLEAQGVIVRTASIIDATLIESPAARPVHGQASSDPEASYTMKRGHIHYGYKAHVVTDATHHLVLDARLTTAKTSDTSVFEELVPNGTRAVYADKGYTKQERTQWLNARGIRSRIMHRASRSHPLTPRAEQFNRAVAKTRQGIERVFAHWKGHYEFHQVRYRSIRKNHVQLLAVAIAYNLKRAASILSSTPPLPSVAT